MLTFTVINWINEGKMENMFTLRNQASSPALTNFNCNTSLEIITNVSKSKLIYHCFTSDLMQPCVTRGSILSFLWVQIFCKRAEHIPSMSSLRASGKHCYATQSVMQSGISDLIASVANQIMWWTTAFRNKPFAVTSKCFKNAHSFMFYVFSISLLFFTVHVTLPTPTFPKT